MRFQIFLPTQFWGFPLKLEGLGWYTNPWHFVLLLFCAFWLSSFVITEFGCFLKSQNCLIILIINYCLQTSSTTQLLLIIHLLTNGFLQFWSLFVVEVLLLALQTSHIFFHFSACLVYLKSMANRGSIIHPKQKKTLFHNPFFPFQTRVFSAYMVCACVSWWCTVRTTFFSFLFHHVCLFGAICMCMCVLVHGVYFFTAFWWFFIVVIIIIFSSNSFSCSRITTFPGTSTILSSFKTLKCTGNDVWEKLDVRAWSFSFTILCFRFIFLLHKSCCFSSCFMKHETKLSDRLAYPTTKCMLFHKTGDSLFFIIINVYVLHLLFVLWEFNRKRWYENKLEFLLTTS